MATIDDLKQSISEMPREQTLEIIKDVRKRRRTRPKSKKKKKKSKAKTGKGALEKAIDKMSLEELEALEKELGRKDE